MEAIGVQLALTAGVFLAVFAGPAIAYFFLHHRKRRARLARRSPIAISLLRSPGHSLREQLDAASGDVMSDVTLLMFVPALTLAVFLTQSHVRGLSDMQHLAPLYVLAVLGFIAYVTRKLLKASQQLDRIRAGYDAELAVGQELNQLMRQGAIVHHDIPADGFNIDHVVIATQGVFAVETKGYTKDKNIKGKAAATVTFDGKTLAFPTWTTRSPLEQANRQAEWLNKWLTTATGSAVPVIPILALPGWFVDRKGRGNVRVYSGKELAGLLNSHRTGAISTQDVQRIAHQVEQRCRTVSPTYRDED